jgi:hypothetical protein
MSDEVFDNGWHTGLGFPLKPMVLLDGCAANKPEYYRAVVVRLTMQTMWPVLCITLISNKQCCMQ